MIKQNLKQTLPTACHPELVSGSKKIPKQVRNDTKHKALAKFKKIVSSNFLLKAAILVFLKESYLFFRNLYGLVVHPFKTVASILKKPDWSQTVLVFGLPVYTGIGVIGAMGLTLVLLLLFQPTNELLVNLVFLFLFCCLLLVVSCSLYLGFWTGKYFLTRKVVR